LRLRGPDAVERLETGRFNRGHGPLLQILTIVCTRVGAGHARDCDRPTGGGHRTTYSGGIAHHSNFHAFHHDPWFRSLLTKQHSINDRTQGIHHFDIWILILDIIYSTAANVRLQYSDNPYCDSHGALSRVNPLLHHMGGDGASRIIATQEQMEAFWKICIAQKRF
jgi:hypothetical protein